MTPVLSEAQQQFDLGWPDQALARLQQVQGHAHSGAERSALARKQAEMHLALQQAEAGERTYPDRRLAAIPACFQGLSATGLLARRPALMSSNR